MSKQAVATAQSAHESEWRDHLTRFSSSGQTVRAFCESESVSMGTFYHWQARLRQRGFVVSKPRLRRQSPVTFVDAGAIPKASLLNRQGTSDNQIEQAERFTIRLELGGDVVLHLERR